jgi:hypothetical protein
MITSLLIVFLASLLLGCSEKEKTNIPDDQLLVKDWSQLEDERQDRLIKGVYEEERIYQSKENYEESKSSINALFDKAFEISPYQDKNLLQAIKEFLHNRTITEKD